MLRQVSRSLRLSSPSLSPSPITLRAAPPSLSLALALELALALNPPLARCCAGRVTLVQCSIVRLGYSTSSLYYALLYCAIRCYTLLYYTMLCYTPLYCTILYCKYTTLCSYAIVIIMLHYTGHPICIMPSHARVCARYGTHERFLSLYIIIIY